MGSSGKKKTTMAKLAREHRLRERRLNKEAKREARRQASSDQPDVREIPLEARMAQSTPPDPDPAAFEQVVQQAGADDREDAPDDAAATDPRAKEAALRRLRDAPDEELAVFEAKLRDDALEAGATEPEMRTAQRNHPGHGA